MEDMTDVDYTHTKRACKDYEIKYLVKYNDLYVQSDTLLLADVFNNFQNMCLEIYWFDAAHVLSTQGLACKANSKNTKVKCHLLTDMDVLLMVEKGISGGIYHAIQKLIS